MKVRKGLLAALTVATIGAGVVGASTVAAAQATTASESPMSSLVSAIATKFNLNPSEVQQVFDEHRTEMKAERQQAMADRVAAAVTKGTITQEQADKITARMQEMKGFMDTLRDKTPEERRAAMKTQMTDLKEWAAENNVPLSVLPMGSGERDGRMGGPRMHNQGSGVSNASL
jgi:hypothetical protein